MTCTIWGLILVLSSLLFYVESRVTTLDTSNFEMQIGQTELTFVEFYQEAISPEFYETARLVPDFPLAAVHCKSNPELLARYHIPSCPFYKVWIDGNDSDFVDEPTAKNMIYYCLSILDSFLNGPVGRDRMSRSPGEPELPVHSKGSVMVHLHNELEFDAFLEVEDVSVIGFFHNHSSQELNLYHTVADTNVLGLAFGIVHAQSLFKRFAFTQDKVCVFMHGKMIASRELDDFIPSNVADWILSNSFQPLAQLTADNLERKLFDGLPSLVTFTSENSSEALIADLKEAAYSFQGTLSFLLSEYNDMTEILNGLGLDHLPEPVIVIVDPMTEEKFLFNQIDVNVETIKRFCVDYLDQMLIPFLRSAPLPTIPIDPNTGIHNLVANSLDTIAKDTSPFVLLAYAPWCPHSQKFIPAFETVAKQIHTAKFGIFNVDDNDFPSHIQVNAIPTVLLFNPGADSPIVYDGNRSESSLAHFILSNMRH